MMKAACLLRARAEKKREQNEVGEGRIGGPRQVARGRWLKKDSNSGVVGIRDVANGWSKR